MAQKTLSDISSKMRNLDICMMSTISTEGKITSRPMSNNGDVEYDGNSYFFTYEEAETVRDLENNPHINLTFNGADGLYITVIGNGQLKRDKEELEEHWLDELNKWFKDGVDTKGIVLIHVKAEKIKYWKGEEQEEVVL